MNKKEKLENSLDLDSILESIGSKTNIKEEEIKKTLLGSIEQIFNSQYNPDAKLEIEITTNKKGDHEVILWLLNKEVVDHEPEGDEKLYSITIDEAKKINPSLEVGDFFKDKISFSNFNPSTFKKISQVFRQTLGEQKKEYLFSKYEKLIGQVKLAKIEGINLNKNGKKTASVKILLENDTLDASLPFSLQNPKIDLNIGESILVAIETVKPDAKGIRVIVSNISNKILENYLKVEIPEIGSGNILVKSISRIAGFRSKIAVVKSPNAAEGIEAIGSVVGEKGSRINEISKKLGDEKIDVILFDENIEKFIVNAISPAHVISIFNKKNEAFPQNNHFLLVVPNDDHTKAIGKSGNNVKLAAELTKSRLDIISLNEAKESNLELIKNGNIDENNIIKSKSFNNSRSNSSFNNRSFSKSRDFNSNTKPQYDSFNSIMEDFDREVANYKSNILSLQDDEKDFMANLQSEFLKTSNSQKNISKPSSNLTNTQTNSKDSFTEEDYKKIENDFVKDSFISKYDDLNLDVLDVEEGDWD